MDSTLKWFLGAFVVGSGIMLVTRQALGSTEPPSREPNEAEDIADWRRKMGLPPEGTPGAAPGQRIVLCFGDSLTAEPSYFKYIKLPMDGRIDGKGWSGKSINTVIKNAIPIMAKIHPTDVVFLAGVNDVASKHSAATVKKDLQAAWKQIHDRGARVWAVKLTPWFGYRSPSWGPVTDSMKTITREVNAWMDAMRGQPGGPEYTIDTAPLGDEEYRLKKEYGPGGLHMSPAGKRELARLVQQAL